MVDCVVLGMGYMDLVGEFGARVMHLAKAGLLMIGLIALAACNNTQSVDIASVPTPESGKLHRVPLAVEQPNQGKNLVEKVVSTIAPQADLSLLPAETSNKTKFSSATFGVKGSPRVTTQRNVRKGGGRYQIGKPYTIRGITYYPRLDPELKQVGLASWYGPNFHGRLTANGEVYDQYALSAAHPTMPLPSYAKVTNLENGSSVIVRVNDRGPFSKNRVIDLSARAAQFLGYTKQGVAKVKVEYAGQAPLHGLDEEKLLASYNPGNVDPSTIPNVPGLSSGNVVVANNTNTPIVQQVSSSLVETQTSGPVSTSPVPRPSALVNSMFAEVVSSEPFDQVLDLSKTTHAFDPPVDGMDSLVQIKFGPFETYSDLVNAEKLLASSGIVEIISDETNDEQLLLLITARENRESVISKSKNFGISEFN